MAYYKAKLKSNGDRASPCFKPFLIGNMSDKQETKNNKYVAWNMDITWEINLHISGTQRNF